LAAEIEMFRSTFYKDKSFVTAAKHALIQSKFHDQFQRKAHHEEFKSRNRVIVAKEEYFRKVRRLELEEGAALKFEDQYFKSLRRLQLDQASDFKDRKGTVGVKLRQLHVVRVVRGLCRPYRHTHMYRCVFIYNYIYIYMYAYTWS